MLEGIIFSLKWITALVVVWLYKIFRRRRLDVYDIFAKEDPEKLGFLAPNIEIQLESPYPESHLLTAADEIFFYGVNSSSECLIARIARSGGGQAEAWIYLKLKDGRTYHLRETAGYERNLGDRVFSCGGLQMSFEAPMRRWRILFNGLLSETTADDSFKGKVFVKLVFLWKASSDIYDLTSDIHDSLTAKAMAEASWSWPFMPPIKKLPETLDMYCQSGVFTGLVSADDLKDYEMYIFGEKIRSLGKSSSIAGAKFQQLLGNTPENGLVFHLGEMTIPNMFDKLNFGFVVPSSGMLKGIEDSHIIEETSVAGEESKLSATFHAGVKYELNGNVYREPIELIGNHGENSFVQLRYVEFTIRNRKGSGVLITSATIEEPEREREAPELHIPDSIPLTVNFSEEISQLSELSGGKGASLAKLTKLSEDDETFVVPKGIIVTIFAYSKFLTREIQEKIKDLEDIAYGNVEGDLKRACKIVSASIVKTSLPEEICRDIEEKLNNLFDSKINLHKFAVRSSATGEDTEQMSAAGQMETFLGVQGLREIFTSIRKCWASQFGYIAVEYKRRYGQLLNSPMAVVVQEMVDCEVAGVLFTCDPLTSNPSVITLAGNYGLGESVVSGSQETDTVTLQRENGAVSVKKVTIGAKNRRIVMQDDGGVTTEEVPEEAKDKCCIPDGMAIELGELAIKIESYYKSPRDIEWGIKDSIIYILQSRPVTSGTLETEFEIKHEFDSPLRCEVESFSKANVGEVFPGSTSPLGMDLIFNYFRVVFQHEARSRSAVSTLLWNNYFTSGMVHFYNQVFMMVADILSRLGEPESRLFRGTMIGVFGRLLDDEEVFQVAAERSENTENATPSARKLIRELFFGLFGYGKIKKHVTNFSFPTTELKNSREMFEAITKSFGQFNDAFERHMTCSHGSMMWNMFLFSLLGRNRGSLDNQVYGDFARLLSSSTNVESADVPAAMKDLARWIVKERRSREFKAMPLEDALEWLQNSSSKAGKKFRIFLKRHGHRCLKEFDIRSKTWGDDPKSLVQLLQNLSASCEEESRRSEDSELNTPLNFISRCLVRFLLPNCRRAVGEREQCKSVLIKAIDNWRKGFLHLGKLMVSEGRIPDQDFLFFLTLNELRELLETRSPKIMAKVIRRRQLHPTLNKYRFPEMTKGVPQPMNDETNMVLENVADLTMTGIPVSQGVARGHARVALSLEEAANLESGEILITYSTDIGWSPYFPLLSGVATELGGLISHGAVVSREYGLPCVVGLHGATRQFQTGDFVLLDGSRGTLQKLPEPNENI